MTRACSSDPEANPKSRLTTLGARLRSMAPNKPSVIPTTHRSVDISEIGEKVIRTYDYTEPLSPKRSKKRIKKSVVASAAHVTQQPAIGASHSPLKMPQRSSLAASKSGRIHHNSHSH